MSTPDTTLSGWIDAFRSTGVAAVTRQVPREEWKHIDWWGGCVPTFISTCPHCAHETTWRTTGIWPGDMTCEKCGGVFSGSLPTS